MLIIGLASTGIEPAERELLAAEQVTGVILFRRNFADVAQLQALVTELRALRGERFLLCVDQEGGPVQRFAGHGLSDLPALAGLGDLFDRDPAAAVALAEQHAWLMASEMRALGIDLSFAPVLDLARGNRAIGRRALHADPQVVADLGTAYLRGMHLAGMAATIKHYPGHGSVLEDTHFDDARDPRPLAELQAADLVPFAAAIEAGAEAVMMAHVAYPAVDAQPAGYSSVWIKDILRQRMGFAGVVISDDIAMAAAAPAGDVGARVAAHLEAGCDLVLACQPEVAAKAVQACRELPPCAQACWQPLLGSVAQPWAALQADPQHARARQALAGLDAVATENLA